MTRVPTRVAQGGVALGLMLSTGAVVVTADADETTTVAPESVETLARAVAQNQGDAYIAMLQNRAVDAASSVIVTASDVRADAEEAAVPADALAELDAATAELEAALAAVGATSTLDEVVDRTASASRSVDRSADAPAAEPTAAADPAGTTLADAPAAPAAAATGAVTSDAATAVALPSTVEDPETSELLAALDRVTQAAAEVRVSTQEAVEAAAAQKAAEEAAAKKAAEEAAAQKAAEEAAAAQRAAWKASLLGYDNGAIPDSALCSPSFDGSVRLRCDAAEALDALDAAFFARFGTHLKVTDSYRSYAAQVACRAAKGSLCALPGTSNHGMGLAVDLGGNVQSFGTAQHDWMLANASAYDWELPTWARVTGSKPEPWHWEYIG
ncbi:D-alanyl-D-alanine carboxypeptidase family protein [Cellulomonas sp. SLBN-39]|uniref:M15 family metallopeptidase n=1 Tax=Cellulomonas sp. SLBN-39 TaxID=2768446 RepID=UPI0011537A2B|nr:M15 family metallopeptidase [Cellulomonas sp. SLBN-39]TQL01744.1 D-alanyl-D-alanine carboxypeptidase-like protein [Cellulomonas sp. SLBN-39]